MPVLPHAMAQPTPWTTNIVNMVALLPRHVTYARQLLILPLILRRQMPILTLGLHVTSAPQPSPSLPRAHQHSSTTKLMQLQEPLLTHSPSQVSSPQPLALHPTIAVKQFHYHRTLAHFKTIPQPLAKLPVPVVPQFLSKPMLPSSQTTVFSANTHKKLP